MGLTITSEPPRGANFRQASLALSPVWLQGDVGGRYMYTSGIQLDAVGEYLRIGALQRFPEYCETAALAHLGRDRTIFRGLSETDAAYASRLRKFKKTWQLAGNAPTLIEQLFALMSPNCTRIRYVTEGPGFTDWWTVDATSTTHRRVTPANWNWDNLTGQCRFWIIVYRSDLVPAKWGVPPYSWGQPGLIWGGDPGSNVRNWLSDCYAIVKAFKAAGSAMGPWSNLAGGLIVADATATGAWGAGGPFDPDLPAGSPMPNGMWADPAQRTRDGAIYLSGVS